MLALSKTLDPEDYAQLQPELKVVDRHFTKEREQHLHRKWEYSMALRAIDLWQGQSYAEATGYDIGGAGSPFTHMAKLQVVDPDAADPAYRDTLEQFACAGAPLANVVTCLSVVEHVDNLNQFLYHLTCLVAPGGLLFLTLDCCDCPSPHTDTHHFHWMRKRILNRADWADVQYQLCRYQCRRMGDYDPDWHGAQVYNYSFASLAMVKRS